jgi:hypothetical protein
VIVLGIAFLFLGSWVDEKVKKQQREEMALMLGVSVTELEKEELIPKIVEVSSERYSSDLLTNRLSDFCGLIRTVWVWFGSLLEIVVLLAVLWYTFTDSKELAIFAWSIVGISLFFWITTVLFSFLCRLFTGRFPGQAKLARKAMSEFLNSRVRQVA